MGKRVLRFVCVAVLFLIPVAAPAALISDVEFAGPGGSAINSFVGQSYIEPSFTFSSVDYIDMTVTVDGPGTYDINEAPLFGYVKNSTGTTWTGFNLINETPAAGSFDAGWIDYSSTFSNVSTASNLVSMTGGTVSDSANMDPIGNFTTTAGGTFTIREVPIAAVPEPSSILLLFAGLAACAVPSAIRRRRL